MFGFRLFDFKTDSGQGIVCLFKVVRLSKTEKHLIFQVLVEISTLGHEYRIRKDFVKGKNVSCL